ncbi:signal peptidase I [Demetria terragena]|uniref:signal peptidase I n=1 Tax=Demetria terragena TaxID=63959 RepID=UPI000377BB07|nr:signal peptidase I [Demetria terragena]
MSTGEVGSGRGAFSSARAWLRAKPRHVRWAILAGPPVALIALAVLVLMTFSVTVVGSSMEPTLRVGDRLFLNALTSGSEVSRFDIVQARLGPDRQQSVKRVIGLPGDRVRIRHENGRTTVEVAPAGAKEWFRVTNPAWEAARQDRLCCDARGRGASEVASTRVPEGSVWLLGDNLDASDDSRTFGFVPVEEIGATLNLRVLPLSRLGPVPKDGIALRP